MATVSYNIFIETIFKSPNLDRSIQGKLIEDLRDNTDPAYTLTVNAEHILDKANMEGYNVITRFVPPYCSTVTFYKETVGFVSVSRLGPAFNNDTHNTAWGLLVTQGAVDTLVQAYADTVLLNGAKAGAAVPGPIANPRGKAAHAAALAAATKPYNDVYVRMECPVLVPAAQGPHFLFIPPSENGNWRRFEYWLRSRFHDWFGDSKINFRKGPAAVLNDFLYNTHDGMCAKNVHVIGGELSAHLSKVGKFFALLNLNAINVGVSGLIGLFVAANIGDTGIALMVAASLLAGLFLWQSFWTWLMTTTTYDNIVSNDFRLRTEKEAPSFFGINRWHLALLLAMLSPQEHIHAHGIYRSLLDVADTGILEMTTGPAPPPLVYHAGYITSSLDPSEIDNGTGSCSALAAWVPYDTHRITYPSNDKVRKFSIVDGFLHMSSSSRASLEDREGKLIFKHDGDELSLPRKLRMYWKEMG